MAGVPATPFGAVIESITADGVGTLRATGSGGETFRFGASACKGFRPVEGAAVIVNALAPHPLGGMRPTSITLDVADRSYDEKIAQQNAALGRKAMTAAEAAHTSRALADIVVLLDEPIPTGPLAAKAWAAQFPFEAHGIEVRTEPELAFVIDGRNITAYPGDAPYPAVMIDRREVGEAFDAGRAFVGLNANEPIDLVLAMGGPRPDLWAEDGTMRRLSRLAAALLARGRGVVVPRAGELVTSADDFVRRLGDLDDPECRPFGAWLDVVMHGEPLAYRTFGMATSGFPDVAAPVDAADRWSRARAHEAILCAAWRMVRENRAITVGESLRVPIGSRFGAWGTGLAEGDALDYAVERGTATPLLLRPPATAIDPLARWAAQDVAPNTYAALLESRLAGLIPSELEIHLPSRNPQAPPHAMQVRRLADGRGFLVHTNGFGRTPQPGGGEIGVAHVELGALTNDHSMRLLSMLGGLGTYFATRPPDSAPWKPNDTLAMPDPERDLGGFVLAGAGDVRLDPGPPVTLLLLIPMTPGEYATARSGGAAAWLAREAGPHNAASLAARWDRFLR